MAISDAAGPAAALHQRSARTVATAIRADGIKACAVCCIHCQGVWQYQCFCSSNVFSAYALLGYVQNYKGSHRCSGDRSFRLSLA